MAVKKFYSTGPRCHFVKFCFNCAKTLSITTFSIMTLSITTFSIMALDAEFCYADCAFYRMPLMQSVASKL